MQQEDILVIGAGPAGLAVSAYLHRRGLPQVIVERDHIKSRLFLSEPDSRESRSARDDHLASFNGVSLNLKTI